jgi:hypothetical protein
MVDQFEANRTRAKESLYLAQIAQQHAYNKDRGYLEFGEGDLVVLNPHSLHLLHDEKGRGQKLLMKYDGPFEILRKLSPITYHLRLPKSYGIHPIISIAHLEKYNPSPASLGIRPTRHLSRADFEDLPEVDVDRIIAERWFKRGSKRIRKFKVRWKGFGPEDDEWLTKAELSNAPLALSDWLATRGSERH